ncbi:hypothetical protein CAC42_6066 [Sphaceloma murrayae]|uniref:Uncharacterized protein n=1 Tax=Sphaceloma murrayae TaxID=2082308 RepID=A0A2K1QV94_9PEZI|nr:hypothetical protein CAC42_6066 [Sphaceloma murrayae]
MRDRRNTNLSISISSQSSASVSPVTLSDVDAVETGRFLLLPEKTHNEPLPSPLLKHAQETQRRQPLYRRVWSQTSGQNLVMAVLFAAFFFWRALLLLSSFNVVSLDFTRHYDIAGGTFPTSPEPVVVQDAQANKKWTVSIPSNASFPLLPYQYKDICDRITSVRRLVEDGSALPRNKVSYTTADPLFIDPSSPSLPQSSSSPSIAVLNASPDDSLPPCSSSLTYHLSPSESGLGASLLPLWLAYGLAQAQNRAFFLSDSHWSYGQYTSYFPAPPVPKCLPPPAHHVVPCPPTAKHLVVSAATLPHTFGPSFHAAFERSHRSGIAKQKKIFAMARAGYEALFGLNGEDREFAAHRTRGIRDAAERRAQEVIGVHIRHGDRRPFEYEFQNDYLPLERYIDAAVSAVTASQPPRAHSAPSSSRKGGSVLSLHAHTAKTINASEPLAILIASDDPDIVPSTDLSDLIADRASQGTPFRLDRAQERIVLASKNNLLPTVPQRKGAFVKHIDQVSGWEGGFFASLFRGLGRPNLAKHATFSSAREHRIEVEERLRKQREGTEDPAKGVEEENALAMRELVGRGYLLDVEVLGRSDRLVCAVSSATCRLLGVVMGWDKVKAGRWVNVDDGRGWSFDGEQ